MLEIALSLAELKRRVSMQYLIDGDAKSPDVSFLTVAVEDDSFG